MLRRSQVSAQLGRIGVRIHLQSCVRVVLLVHVPFAGSVLAGDASAAPRHGLRRGHFTAHDRHAVPDGSRRHAALRHFTPRTQVGVEMNQTDTSKQPEPRASPRPALPCPASQAPLSDCHCCLPHDHDKNVLHNFNLICSQSSNSPRDRMHMCTQLKLKRRIRDRMNRRRSLNS